MFMVLTWGLTIAAFVLIFIELGDWSAEDNPHAILGVITTAICFFQPFGALFRPSPTSSKRPIFNWLHWFAGNAAHILASKIHSPLLMPSEARWISNHFILLYFFQLLRYFLRLNWRKLNCPLGLIGFSSLSWHSMWSSIWSYRWVNAYHFYYRLTTDHVYFEYIQFWIVKNTHEPNRCGWKIFIENHHS